ncbi:MAG: YraN family protein [Patescibacteria group bacterium]|nr:YraN family protein [Patescibacteria group bacterium]
MNYNQKIGRLGENIAIRYLRKHEYKILDRNVYFRCGEIDIIAKKNNILYFVEVKTRTNSKFGPPEASISAYKILRFERSVLSYFELNKSKKPYFMIIIGVLIDLEHKRATVYKIDI